MEASMIEFQADIDEHGRLVVPLKTRKFLGLNKGDNLNLAVLGVKPSGTEEP